MNRIVTLITALAMLLVSAPAHSSIQHARPDDTAKSSGANVGGILPQLKREKPDMAQIYKEITDRNSPYYYPALMKEYERNDTLMKLDKFRRLYLGYMFQEDYDPYRPSSYLQNVESVYNRPNPNRHETDSIIKYAEMALRDNPFNLTQMIGLIHALRLKGKKNLAAIWQYKLNYLLMAIVSTGTGLDEENAWYVIEPSHEYVLLNMMGYTVTSPLFYDPYYEYLKVMSPGGRQSGGFYFNIKTILEEYYRKFPEQLTDDDADEGEIEEEDDNQQ